MRRARKELVFVVSCRPAYKTGRSEQDVNDELTLTVFEPREALDGRCVAGNGEHRFTLRRPHPQRVVVTSRQNAATQV